MSALHNNKIGGMGWRECVISYTNNNKKMKYNHLKKLIKCQNTAQSQDSLYKVIDQEYAGMYVMNKQTHLSGWYLTDFSVYACVILVEPPVFSPLC